LDKENKILADKLDKFPSKKAIKNFYWDRDMARKSIKAKAYKKNKFEKTRDYLKLNFKYPEISNGFPIQGNKNEKLTKILAM